VFSVCYSRPCRQTRMKGAAIDAAATKPGRHPPKKGSALPAGLQRTVARTKRTPHPRSGCVGGPTYCRPPRATARHHRSMGVSLGWVGDHAKHLRECGVSTGRLAADQSVICPHLRVSRLVDRKRIRRRVGIQRVSSSQRAAPTTPATGQHDSRRAPKWLRGMPEQLHAVGFVRNTSVAPSQEVRGRLRR